MIVIFELEHDCKKGTQLPKASRDSLLTHAGRVLPKCTVAIIAHRGEGKLIKHRHQSLTYKVEPLVDIAAGL